MKLELKETEAVLQKASTDLRKVREKHSVIRTEKKDLDLKLVELNEQVAGLEETISVLETQTLEGHASVKSFSDLLNDSAQKLAVSEISLDIEREHGGALQKQVTNLRGENRKIRPEYRSTSACIHMQQLEERYDGLKNDYHNLQDEKNQLAADARWYQSCREWYKKDSGSHRGMRDTIQPKLQPVEQELTAMTTKYYDMSRLHAISQTQCLEWQDAYYRVKPLAKIGASIRVRFPDQARELRSIYLITKRT